MIVLGLEQGGLASRSDDAFLPDGLRDALGDGLQAPEAGDLERHLLYVALARGRRRVVVCRRVASDDGRPLEPSPLWYDVVRAAGGALPVIRRGLADVAWTVAAAPTARERARAVSRLAADDSRRAERIADADGLTRRLRRAQNAYQRPTRIRDPQVLSDLAALDRFPVTALERFGDCSSWWFVERHLEPARHRRRVRRAPGRHRSPTPRCSGSTRACPPRSARIASSRATPTRRRQRDPRARRRGDARPDAAVRHARGADRGAAGGPRPRRGSCGRTRRARRRSPRPASRSASAAPARRRASRTGCKIEDFAVAGKIDRIDTDPSFSAHALVQDYKSGKTAWTARQLNDEGRLQIPLYILAARELLGLEPIGGLYRALGPRRRRPRRGRSRRGRRRAAGARRAPTWSRPTTCGRSSRSPASRRSASSRRIRVGDIRHDPRGGSCPWYCPWAGVCRIAAMSARPPSTTEQRRAIEAGGVVFVSAGAGTGKTRVLVERFARAVLDRGLAPDRVLAITYTERAAAELAGAHPRAAGRGRARRAGARARRRVDLDHPRLLRPRSCAATRSRPGSTRRSSCSIAAAADLMRAESYDAALRQMAASREDVLDLVTAYGEDRLRTLIDGTHERLRTAGHPLRFDAAPAASLPDAIAKARDAALALARVARPGPAAGRVPRRARRRWPSCSSTRPTRPCWRRCPTTPRAGALEVARDYDAALAELERAARDARVREPAAAARRPAAGLRGRVRRPQARRLVPRLRRPAAGGAARADRARRRARRPRSSGSPR